VFVDGVRTPFGKAGDKGMYAQTRADDLVVDEQAPGPAEVAGVDVRACEKAPKANLVDRVLPGDRSVSVPLEHAGRRLVLEGPRVDAPQRLGRPRIAVLDRRIKRDCAFQSRPCRNDLAFGQLDLTEQRIRGGLLVIRLRPLERSAREPAGGLEVAHPNRDEFWQKRALMPHLKNVAPAVMVVTGWYVCPLALNASCQ